MRLRPHTRARKPTTPPLVAHLGLDRESVPFRLYQKAKQLGAWDPQAIDLSPDIASWPGLDDDQRDFIVRLLALFVGGEESVVADLVPVLAAIGAEGRLEEELYLTTFLSEEAKHVEFFCRYLEEVVGDAGDLTRFHGPAYRRLLYRELPDAMEALRRDMRPQVQARAAVTYMVVTEGVLAEAAYDVLFAALEDQGALPGLCAGLRAIKRDESRHVSYGLHWLGRLVRSHPETWATVESRFAQLTPIALRIAGEAIGPHETVPFGMQAIAPPAGEQLRRRRAYLERLRTGAEDPGHQLDISRSIG